MSPRRRACAVLAAPAVLGLLLGVLALGPGLGPGFVLRYDLLFVPDPPLLPPTGGFPRAVPSDLVAALLARVLSAEVAEKVLLLSIFVLAASGAAALAPGDRLLPRLACAAFYAWNLYLAQRLLLGQWALLLGVAGLPWAVRAVAGRWWRLALALLPAMAGGFQAMAVTALTLLPVAWFQRRRVLVLVLLACCSLPWLAPALAAGLETDPAGVDAFAARADGPFGVLGSLLGLGGIWSADAGVPGQQGWWPATARLALAVAGLMGFARLRGRGPWWPGLAVAAVGGYALAALGAVAPGPLKGLIGLWAGFGPLRDGQAYLAPVALAAALGLSRLAGGRRVTGLVALLAPLLVLPTFAWGAFHRLEAVRYPAEWLTVQRMVNADPLPGALVSLPWGAHRAFGWNGGRVLLDPATKLFDRRVIWDDALLVGLPGGGRLRVRGEDPLARRVGAALDEPWRWPGVRYVLVAGGENLFRFDRRGWTVVFRGPELTLLRNSGVPESNLLCYGLTNALVSKMNTF